VWDGGRKERGRGLGGKNGMIKTSIKLVGGSWANKAKATGEGRKRQWIGS